MTITVLTNTATPTRVIQRSPLLARVMAWELRRFCASRLFWVQALGFFGFSLFLTWALHAPVNFPQVSNGVQFRRTSSYPANRSGGAGAPSALCHG